MKNNKKRLELHVKAVFLVDDEIEARAISELFRIVGATIAAGGTSGRLTCELREYVPATRDQDSEPTIPASASSKEVN